MSMLINKKINIVILIVISIIVGLLSVTIGSLYYTNMVTKSLGILVNGLLICIVMLGYVKARYKKTRDVFDFGLLFGIFFLGYNGIILINVSLNFILTGNHTTNYPVLFDIDSYLKASVASLIASVGLIIGELIFLTKIKNDLTPKFNQKKDFMETVYLFVGFLIYLIGIILLFINYQRIGGFFYALQLDRGVRMDLLSQASGNLPYSSFVFTGISLMSFSVRNNFIFSKKNFLVYMCLVVWIGLMFIQGDRRYLLYSLLIFLTVFTITRRIGIKYYFLMAVFTYLVFSIYQQVRYLLPLIVKGNINFMEIKSIIFDKINFQWILPGNTEFAGPYFTLLWNINQNMESYILGYSYIMSIPNVLPRSLYPGEKPPTIAQEFAYNMHDMYYPTRESMIGWGYSPVAESYINFGFIGIFVVFILFSLMFKYISYIKYKSMYGLLISSILLPEAFNLNRTSFSSVVQETFFNLMILVAGILMVLVIGGIVTKNSRLARKDKAKPIYLLKGSYIYNNVRE